MDKQVNNYCLDFAHFYEARSAKIKPVGSFLKVTDMNQRTSDSNAAIDEEVSQQDKGTSRGMGGEMSTQAYVEELKWPVENLSMQQQQKPSIQELTQAQKRMCAQRSGCRMHHSYHPGDYLAKQPHQCQKYQKNFDQSPGKQQQPSQDPQQQQPKQQYLEQTCPTPPIPKQCIQTSYPKHPQEQAQRNDSPTMKASSMSSSSKELSNTAVGQPSSCLSNTDEENFAENIDESDKKTSNMYMEFVPQHYSHQQQHSNKQYQPDLNQNSPQRNQSQKRAPISKTTDVLSPRPQQYGPQKPKMLCKNTDVIDFDKDLKGLDKNSSYKYMEYVPKLCQSPPHQTNQNIFHKHKQEHHQMMSPSRQKIGKQQAKHIQLSPPHQYSCLLEPDKWGRETGGELLAKNSDILTSTSLSDISEKNCEDSTVKQKRYNKCGRCSDENGTNSTSTGTTVITVKCRDELRSMVRNEMEIHSVFGELSDTVVSQLKDYLCALSTTDNVPPPKSQYKDSQCTNAPKNSAIDNVLDTKKQESYQTQNKASFGKGIPKPQEVRVPQNPGLARENAEEFQSMSTPYKSMEYVPNQGLLQYPTQRTYQDLTKEQTQKSERSASYHKNQKQHSYRTFKLEAKQNSQQKQSPNQQISDSSPFACFSDMPEDDSEGSIFEADKKTLNKLMEGSPKDKLKHRLSGDEHDVFSMASSNSVSTSISAKSGDELRAMIWDEIDGDQKSMRSQFSRTTNATSSKPRHKDVKENVSISSDLSQPSDDGNQDRKETMSKHPNIASLPNLAIDVNAPTTDSFKGSKRDELPQIECSMSIDDLVNCKVITPMIMKIHNKYMTSMQDAMQLMKYLETVPRLVGQIYKDNIKLEQKKL
ncbi:putative mediator of RNA polymerase II transcription subunit 26 [Drosophila pseudoobscura]|uniref:Mediator of RNA polymerase II transcription subunit 26 n=1 Tax=Drosophila pseudoobscura pseudoobscura TaxID=46245 RepID=A0A6I8VHK3_DROPS|nr:putative mediator of RNA polymerase II transcription subunit 26 [Drosophila pseudoobscura]